MIQLTGWDIFHAVTAVGVWFAFAAVGFHTRNRITYNLRLIGRGSCS